MKRNKESTRGRILATARQLYAESLATAPTMDDIASAVGIGRATLYRHFDNRDELLMTVLEQEALEIAERVEKRIRKIEAPAEYIVEGTLQALIEIQKSDLPASIFNAGNAGTVNRLLFDSDRLVNIGISIMAPMVANAQAGGELQARLEPELLMEWILRTLISLATVPSKQLKTRAAVRQYLHATMMPVLDG